MLNEFFPSAEQSKQISDDVNKVIEINELINSYISKAKDKIEFATKNGNTSVVLSLGESSENLNRAISNRIVEFLVSKGYKAIITILMDNVAMIQISW